MNIVTLKGCVIEDGKFINHGTIKFIDFGVSKLYLNKSSFKKCKKYVGKVNYQAPKTYLNKPFDASKAGMSYILYNLLLSVCIYFMKYL